SVAAVDAAGGAGLAYDDAVEQRQRRLEPLPDPLREPLAGRIVEPLDLVQIAMVELVEQWLEGGLHVCEVHHPPEPRVDRSGDVNLDLERMPMHARALVSVRHVRQPMRRLDLKNAEEFHAWGRTDGFDPR